MKHIVLAGGGTAGHVNPLLSVAASIAKLDPSAQVSVIGTAVGLEHDLVPAAGFELDVVDKLPFPRRLNKAALRFPSLWRREQAQVRAILERRQADVVVGFGGYASAPAYTVAHKMGLPIAVHEQNARAGMANKLGSRWASFIGTAYVGTGLKPAKGARMQRVGLPLRPAIAALCESFERDRHAARVEAAQALGLDPTRPVVVVTGGSLGALSVNRAVAAAAPELLDVAQVVHLTGKGKADEVRAAVSGVLGEGVVNDLDSAHAGLGDYHVAPYLERIDLAFACADLVICRSGAGSVSELTALGLPAVYVPLPIGNGEQRFNAEPVVQAGGGLMVSNEAFTAAWVKQHVPGLLADAQALQAMGRQAWGYGIRNAADVMAQEVLRLAGETGAVTPERITLVPARQGFDRKTGLEDLGHTHFIGIGGSGMSVLAEMLHERGVEVSGSDRGASAKTKRLQDLGITVQFGQQAEHVSGARTVVYSSAIKPDNPEIVAAAQAGAHIVHRSDILALLMDGKRAVSVAGAHGKTTTSSMLAHMLTHAGQGGLSDPSYAIGGSIQSLDGEAIDGGHAGTGDVMVAESDESDGSFEKYRPDIALITNAEADHLDFYGDADRYRKAFVEYAGHAKRNVVMSVDDEGARVLLRSLPREVISKTIAYTTESATSAQTLLGGITSNDENNDTGLTVVHILSDQEQDGTGRERFTVELPAGFAGCDGDDERRVVVDLQVPGAHNARNATGAIICAALLGMDVDAAAQSLSGFMGASRRFESKGRAYGAEVVDDYAHHPTEIHALLTAARRRYPHAAIRVLFQPHLFSRTAFFTQEFASALRLADDVIVTSIFPAREQSADFPGVSAQTLVDEVQRQQSEQHGDHSASAAGSHAISQYVAGTEPERDKTTASTAGKTNIAMVADMREGAKMLALRAQPGDVLLTVGAGDVTDMGSVMLAVLQSREQGGGVAAEKELHEEAEDSQESKRQHEAKRREEMHHTGERGGVR